MLDLTLNVTFRQIFWFHPQIRAICIYIQIYIYTYTHTYIIRSKTSGKIYMKTKYEIFLQFFLQKVLFLLHFGSCQNCMSFANLVAEIHQKLCNKRVLSTGESCTWEYVTLLQSFYRGTLSIHWYIAQNF